MAFVVSLRSEDLETKHGSIIVSKRDNLILSTGYNGLIKGADHNMFPTSGKEKYSVMIHSEENCLLNTSRSIRDYPGGVKMYVTGKPCPGCLQKIWNSGIDHIVMAKRKGTKLETPETDIIFSKIVKSTGIIIEEMEVDNNWLLPLIKQ